MKSESTTENSTNESPMLAFASLILFVLLGVFLTFFFIDGHHQDAGTHFLYSRWAWQHHDIFVDVWARPLPTLLYAFPAKYGYQITQIFTVLISALVAWQTYELAKDVGIEKRWIVVPLLLLQPSVFLLSTEVMTEPLFALVLAIALRLHVRGWVKTGMFAASLLITIRPEGFFMGLMWGFLILFDKRVASNFFLRGFASLILASGVLLWSVAAYFITGDLLYIKHNWPSGWQASSSAISYLQGLLYVWRLPYIVGTFLIPFFLVGLWQVFKKAKALPVTISFLTLFVLHSVLRGFGLFGSAGYPRYFVCVAPGIAIITLCGWNFIFHHLLSNFNANLKRGIAIATLTLSLCLCLLYKEGEPWIGDEGATWSRDARAVKEVHDWFQQNPRPVNRIVWCQAYMGIIFGRDFYEQPRLTADTESNLKLLRESPSGTLVFWDARTGSNWYTLTAADIESAGYKKIYSKKFSLNGNLIKFPVLWFVHPRPNEFYLLYKE